MLYDILHHGNTLNRSRGTTPSGTGGICENSMAIVLKVVSSKIIAIGGRKFGVTLNGTFVRTPASVLIEIIVQAHNLAVGLNVALIVGATSPPLAIAIHHGLQ